MAESAVSPVVKPQESEPPGSEPKDRLSAELSSEESPSESSKDIQATNIELNTKSTQEDCETATKNSNEVQATSKMSSESSHLAQLLNSSPRPPTVSHCPGSTTSSVPSSSSSVSGMNLMMDSGQCVAKTRQTSAGSSAEPFLCANQDCKKKITDRFLLKALDHYWHEECLKCYACKCKLAEADQKLYYKNGTILCQRDYLNIYGLKGMCAACRKEIPAFDLVMRARTNVYHLECFACQECNYKFCVGETFYLWDNKILCQYHYQERSVFAQSANYNSLAHALKRQFPSEEFVDENKRRRLIEIQTENI